MKKCRYFSVLFLSVFIALPVFAADLTLQKNANGTVNIYDFTTNPPSNIFCGVNCSTQVSPISTGSTVALFAAPEAGYKIQSWSGSCSGSSSICMTTMDTNKTVGVDFELRTDLPACPAAGTPLFTNSFIAPARILSINPMGGSGPSGGNVSPSQFLFVSVRDANASWANDSRTPYVHAPSDAYITEASFKNVLSDDGQMHDDYTLSISPCLGKQITFTHIQNLRPHIQDALGTADFCSGTDFCVWSNKNVALRAGEILGETGYTYGGMVITATDTSLTSLNVANPSRFGINDLKNVCPLDYFADDYPYNVKTNLQSKFIISIGGACGILNPDILGTAAGRWYSSSVVNPSDDSANLSLLQDNSNISVNVFSVGNRWQLTTPSLAPDAYSFTLNTASSGDYHDYWNKEFSTLSDLSQRVYCYDGLSLTYGGASVSNTIFFLQMAPSNTIRMAVASKASCEAAFTDGTWDTSATPPSLPNSLTFYR